MKILLVGYVQGHQYTRLNQEAKKIGIEVVGVYASDLVLKFEKNSFQFYIKSLPNTKLQDFDLIYLGTSSNKRRWEWYTVCEYLAKNFGTIIVNKKYIDEAYNVFWTSASDYLKQTLNNIPYPKSIMFFTKNSLSNIKNDIDFPSIVKIVAPGLTRKGKGVNLVNSYNELKELVDSSKDYADKYILREFIPNNGDIRVFTVGYKAIGAMKRTPKKGDFKSNISQGGTGEEFDLHKNLVVKELAEKFSKIMRVEVGGVDVILDKNTGKPYILEINSNPQFEGLEKYTNVNAAKAIIEYFVSLKAQI